MSGWSYLYRRIFNIFQPEWIAVIEGFFFLVYIVEKLVVTYSRRLRSYRRQPILAKRRGLLGNSHPTTGY